MHRTHSRALSLALRFFGGVSAAATLVLAVAVALALSLAAGFAAPARAATTVRVASGLARPVFAISPPGDGRLFIVEQRGVIRILENGQLLPSPFLDIDDLVPDISGNDERGLLGLAFHPDYATNGWFFVDYINLSGDTVIARYTVSSDPNAADPLSWTPILTIDQPYANHNGGTLLFGPDGMLYIGMGDGGGAGDPEENAQDPGSLLGKILRIDVDGEPPYSIPPDNPFAGPGLPLDEIWDLGVRNPYRWSFDRETGDLWIADVGQNRWEEIDFEPAGSTGGVNYGWDNTEGHHCYEPSQDCDTTGITWPIYEYSHSDGCSITGGVVYRGVAIPSLRGAYFFADYCSNRIWTLRYDGQTVTEVTERTAELAPGGGQSIGSISAFAEDSAGEMYIVDRGSGTDGEVYKIVADTAGAFDHAASSPRLSVSLAGKNPFRAATAFRLGLPRPAAVRASVVDPAG
ncbi:MAG: PQQ-dependent sugar dehydrogenase, partial [Candidatus Eisenbacteria bacterium]|nr:PQQ-dependent sugar dehydrogenase [Candidatus Eisenbacteria bacterium]